MTLLKARVVKHLYPQTHPANRESGAVPRAALPHFHMIQVVNLGVLSWVGKFSMSLFFSQIEPYFTQILMPFDTSFSLSCSQAWGVLDGEMNIDPFSWEWFGTGSYC